MSSHREAPEISKDPTADNTDVYAFVSPDRPGYVTLIANYIPREQPDGGPNFYEFNDEVLYQIFVHNTPTPGPDITYQFRFRTRVLNPNTFLYNTGRINNITDPTWNRPQSYSVTRIDSSGTHLLASGGNSNLMSLPVNIGPRSTPNYTNLVQQAIHNLDSGEKVFAGQRREGFYVDLGSVFDLLALRPFQSLHAYPTPPSTADGNGVNSTVNNDIHTIAIQVPISSLTRDGSTTSNNSSSITVGASPLTVGDPRSVIGVWASASRQRLTIRGLEGAFGTHLNAGPFVQISRLANPLFNELLIQMVRKDFWNTQLPSNDNQFANRVQYPEVASLLTLLYPTAFPNLATITPPEGTAPPAGKPPRADLQAILLSGLPPGIVPNFQNYLVLGTDANGNPRLADLVRLNMAVPAKSMANASPFGILGGDLAGFPNGRRVFDDVATIELRAIAGLTYPLVAPTYKPDAAAGVIYDVVKNPPQPPQVDYNILYNHDQFPYLGTPLSGYDVQYVTSTNTTG